jgi:hypothetical protein
MKNNVVKMPLGMDSYFRAIDKEMRECMKLRSIWDEGYQSGARHFMLALIISIVLNFILLGVIIYVTI